MNTRNVKFESIRNRIKKDGRLWVTEGDRSHRTLLEAAYALGRDDTYPAYVWEIVTALDEVGTAPDEIVRVFDHLGHEIERVREVVADADGNGWEELLAAIDRWVADAVEEPNEEVVG